MNKKFLFITIYLLFYSYIFCVKTEVLNYKIYPTDNFDIYYPKKELEGILPEVEKILEESFKNHTEYFDIKFDYKIPFFIYYGYQQFLQNTIVPVTEGTGGVTEAFKNRFLVPYTGSKKQLQHVINHEFIHEIEFNFLYSGMWRTPLILKSIFYPNWLLEGLAEFRSSLFVKTEQEMLVRDMVVSGKLIPLQHLHNFTHLKPHMILPAYEQSAKLMEFIEREYGKNRVVSLLKLYRERFDVNSVLNTVVYTNIEQLQKKFFEDITDWYNYEISVNSMTDLSNDYYKLTQDDVYPIHCYSPVKYKDKVIYLCDIDGEKLFYYTQKNQTPKLLISKNVIDNNVDIIQTDGTRISVSNNGILCFIGIKNNESYLYLYDLEKRKLKKVGVKNFIDLLVSSYISFDGSYVFISGIKGVNSVIYKYDIKTNVFEKIKEDVNFISDLYVSNDNRKILYTKELPCFKGDVQTWQTDIFLYEPEKQVEQQITFTLSDERFPLILNDEYILFVSDYNKEYDKKFYGVKNLFLISLSDTVNFVQLTNVIGGIQYVGVSNNELFLCYYRSFNQHVYVAPFSIINIKENYKVLSYDKIQTGPSEISLVKLKKIKSYSLKFSTDLFLPFLYFNSAEGLIMFLYWQGSDMVGEHNVNLSSIVLGYDNYSINLQYQMLKFRPVFIFDLLAESLYDTTEDTLTKNTEITTGVSYPLNSISKLNLLLGYAWVDKQYVEKKIYEVLRENIVYLSYNRNTITGKYIEPTKGSYFSAALQVSDRFIDGDLSYVICRSNYINYIHLGKEHGLVTKIQLYYSDGKDKKLFYLGGPERISGIWYSNVTSYKACLLRLGYRMPIVYDINYHMWYLFPDLFFKSLYAETFVDTGIDENPKFYSSYGIKLKLYSFVLQTYILKFELIFAKQFDINKPMYTYFNITGGF